MKAAAVAPLSEVCSWNSCLNLPRLRQHDLPQPGSRKHHNPTPRLTQAPSLPMNAPVRYAALRELCHRLSLPDFFHRARQICSLLRTVSRNLLLACGITLWLSGSLSSMRHSIPKKMYHICLRTRPTRTPPPPPAAVLPPLASTQSEATGNSVVVALLASAMSCRLWHASEMLTTVL